MARSLTYFDIKGLGEGLRYLLHYGNLEFEDIRIKGEDWPNVKDTYEYKKLPVYKEGNVTLNQTVAIARYLGKQLNLTPSDPVEDAQIEAIILTFFDYVQALKNAKPETKDAEYKEATEFYYSKFNERLAKNNGLFGSKLSWAEIHFIGLIDMVVDYMKVSADDYPAIVALQKKVHQLPGIKKYIENQKK